LNRQLFSIVRSSMQYAVAYGICNKAGGACICEFYFVTFLADLKVSFHGGKSSDLFSITDHSLRIFPFILLTYLVIGLPNFFTCLIKLVTYF
jgi:hypothetical protein